MGKVVLETIKHQVWGNCLKLTNGIVELLITLEFGPRIIKYAFVNGENMFWEDVNEGFSLDVEYKGLGKQKFIARGGHRLWISPEKIPNTYYPDNNIVEWKEIENGVIVSSKEEVYTQLKKEFEIIMDMNSTKVKIINRVINKGAWSIKFAPWAITAMSQGGREIIPQPTKDTGLLPNRVIALWPYSNMLDKRVFWGKKYIVLDHDALAKEPFKLGLKCDEGWSAYFNRDCLFIKRFKSKPKGEYPDYGVSYETYTNNYFLEMETLGELKEVEPDEMVEHEEYWELYKEVEKPNVDENQIEDVIKKYI